MKKVILAAFAVLVSLGASAQLISSNTVTSHKAKKSGYTRWSLSYKSISMGDADYSMNGFSLDWTKGISLTSSMPLYLETGLGATYAFKSEDGFDNKWAYLTVPVNVTYRYAIGNSGVTLSPFVGLFLRGSVYGNSSYDDEYYDEDSDWFDSDEGDCNRFQIGCKFGVGVELNSLYLGLSYGTDFSELGEDWKTSPFAVTLGYTF